MGGLFYVYEHWRPDRDICFYVGKGKGRRANLMYGRSSYHTRVQKKLARQGMCVEVRLVADCLDEDDAFDLEIERIAFWRGQGVALANISGGGDGASNPSDETRQKMSAAKKGRSLSAEHRAKIGVASKEWLSDPKKRAKFKTSMDLANERPEVKEHQKNLHQLVPRTKEHYSKVSAALMGRKLSPERVEKTRKAHIGRKHSQEEIEKRRAANAGKKRSPEFCARMKAMWTPERKAALAEKMRNNKELLEKMRKSNIGNQHTKGMKWSDMNRKSRIEGEVQS